MAATPLTIGGDRDDRRAAVGDDGRRRSAAAERARSDDGLAHHDEHAGASAASPTCSALMGTTAPNEMLPSLLAQAARAVPRHDPDPADHARRDDRRARACSFGGQALPIIPPLALKATLTNPTGALAGLDQPADAARRHARRRSTTSIARTATKAQKAYLDSLITSQSQIRSIDQDLLSALGAINDNSVASQITAAIVLIQMNVTPVVAIHIPFGGDNHNDTGLATEAAQTVSGLALDRRC